MPIPLLILAGAAGAAAAGWARSQKKRNSITQTSSELNSAPPETTDIQPPDYMEFLGKHLLPTDVNEASPSPTLNDPETLPGAPARTRLVTPLSITVGLLFLSIGVSLIPTEWFAEPWISALMKTTLISALVGIGTNYIAILLLFKPRKAFLGVQGIIPKKRIQIIDSLASGIRKNLIDEETIQKAIHDSDLVGKTIDSFLTSARGKINDEEFRRDLTELIRETARVFVVNNDFRAKTIGSLAEFAQDLPFTFMSSRFPNMLKAKAGTWLSEKITENQKSIMDFIENKLDEEVGKACDDLVEILKQAPDNFENRRQNVEQYLTKKVCYYATQFDVEKMIKEKLHSMDDSEFYKMINETTEKELAALQYLGAGLGAIAGLCMFFVL